MFDQNEAKKQFDSLVEEWWRSVLDARPELASYLGEKGYGSLSTDFSSEAIETGFAKKAAFLERFESIQEEALADADRLNLDLIVRQLRSQLEGRRFREWEMPVSALPGLESMLAGYVPVLPFESVEDYCDFCVRLRHLPVTLEQLVVQMRNGLKRGMLPLKSHMSDVESRCLKLSNLELGDNPLYAPILKFPPALNDDERARIKRDVETILLESVIPAYEKFLVFLRDEYSPKCREEAGIWSLPDGRDLYSFLVRSYTTPEMTPEGLHLLGHAEVARIKTEMSRVAHDLGFQDLADFNVSMKSNRALYPDSKEDLIRRYADCVARMREKLPLLFHEYPKDELRIVPEDALFESTAPSACYYRGSQDGTRPARMVVNTGDYARRSIIGIETTAYHEGFPGHHLQLSVEGGLSDLPAFRRFGFSGDIVAFGEGWALYAEGLGLEVGLYQDPYSLYGHYQDDLLRAIRLVADTGLHHKGWSRQQVVDYFHEHSGIDEIDVQNEVDRYISDPGQALAYKVGQLKIMELRDYAETSLRSAFDLRDFHAVVLGAGCLPLDILEKRVKAWVESLR